MSETTKAEIDLMRHSLGLSQSAKPYRNYFAATPMHSDMPTIRSLISKGMMFQGATRPSAHGDMTFYHVTDEGCALLGTTRAEAEN